MEELPTPLELRVDQAYDARQIAPRQVYYQTVPADSHTDSATHFTVESPGDGYLLDAAVFCRYQIKMNRNALIRYRPNAIYPARQQRTCVAFRQNYPIARSMRNCTVNINGQVVSSRPIDHMDAFNRVYMTPEESETVATMSSGFYDCDSYVGWNNALQQMSTMRFVVPGGGLAAGHVSSIGILPAATTDSRANDYAFKRNILDASLDNSGFSKRSTKFEKTFTENVMAANGVSGYAADVNIPAAGIGGDPTPHLYWSFTEPIPCSPLAFYARDFNKCIPHVQQLAIQMDWASNFSSRAAQISQYNALPHADFSSQIKLVQKPELLLRWYRTPFPLPPQVPISYKHIHTFYQEYDWVLEAQPYLLENKDRKSSRLALRRPLTFPVNTFRLPRMPNRILLYVKPVPSVDTLYTPSDAFMSIRSLTISVDGVSGRLLGAQPEQLYRSFISHSKGCKPAFEDWYKYMCIAHLTPVDLGMVDTDVVPIDRPITINIQELILEDNHLVPGALITPVNATGVSMDFGAQGLQGDSSIEAGRVCLYILAIYDSRPFILTENGSASLQL